MKRLKLKKRHRKRLIKRVKDEQKTDDILKKEKVILDSGTKFISGAFWSDKNNRRYAFRSGYELGYLYIIEKDDDILSYIVEPFAVPYIDPYTKAKRNYIPDIILSRKDGSIEIIEIKPKNRMRNLIVRAKANAVRKLMKDIKSEIKFRFVTEDEIFNTKDAYNKFLKEVRKNVKMV